MREYHNRADVNLTVSEHHAARSWSNAASDAWSCGRPRWTTSCSTRSRRSAAMRDRLSGGRPERPLLLTVSRLAPEKNVGFLADVLRRIPEARRWPSSATGRTGRRSNAASRAPTPSSSAISKGKELAAAYASADAFVYASETETMGNVVLEAMACGCPVVAPRAGGIPSLLEHGRTGFLYRRGDVADAARCVRTRARPTRRCAPGSAAAARQAVEGRNGGISVGRVRRGLRRGHAGRRSHPAAADLGGPAVAPDDAALVSVFKSLRASPAGNQGRPRRKLRRLCSARREGRSGR